ncbi:spore germination protein [Paenibacillus agricola]|uniref:Spore germination protein n=1 Tax=Paenibacillus agricola TaxID=2716264 RepID=A0ABX0J2S7_9BACL|nr:spore germination protein [Paenibacillus agricola]NHN30667.1 spore germination protein [Paenibacillus agricola]
MGLTSTIKKMLGSTSHSIQPQPLPQEVTTSLHKELALNITDIQLTMGHSPDLVIRELKFGQNNIQLALLYIEGLAEPKNALEFLMKKASEPEYKATIANSDFFTLLTHKLLAVGELKQISTLQMLCQSILNGDTVLMLDGFATGLSLGTKQSKDRNVEEPGAQTVVRGPRDGFTETLRTNIALVRRRIKSTDFRMEIKIIGRVTKTDIAIIYIQGIVNEKVLSEVRKRIDRIDIDAILESGYIEELIQDETYTPFPTVYNTERPDTLAAGILEGRVAILVDGTPFALTVPALFTEFFQSAEDYYQRADFATLLRILRYFCFFITLLAPSMYIAITTFHHELLPPELLIRLVAAREGVPFPAFVEALLMEITFEILREAGVRMPRTIGQAVSIVGTLVIGQAAVEAGLVSPAMVIIVSITAISNFVIPSFNMGISLRILRFFIMFLAASFGLFGIVVGLITIILHLCSLRSFGIPYMSPFAPLIFEDQKDSIFRFPHWALVSRPHLLSQKNNKRGQTPKPSPEEQT